MSDVICVQEHRLYEDELRLIDNVHSDFVLVCTSALVGYSSNSIRCGHPWVGVRILIHKMFPSKL